MRSGLPTLTFSHLSGAEGRVMLMWKRVLKGILCTLLAIFMAFAVTIKAG